VFVGDLARMNLFFAEVGEYALRAGEASKRYQGVSNAGSGKRRSFNEVAEVLMAVHGEAKIQHIPVPAELAGRYQYFAQADLSGLRAAGFDMEMTPLEEGVRHPFGAAIAAFV